jgi:phosphoserine phosphatase
VSTLAQYVLTCVAPQGITNEFVSAITSLIKTQFLTVLNSENTKPNASKVLDFSLATSSSFDSEKMKTALIDCSHKFKVDMALIKDDAYRLNRKLIVFDMDSTLIQAEVIDELARVHGIGDKVMGITERAMNGEINFDQSIRERVALLKGLSSEKMEAIYQGIKLTDGVEDFIKTVRAEGYKTAIVSGGFRYFAERFQKRLGMDYAFANELEIENGFLTGKVKGEILNAQKKVDYIELIALREKFNIQEVVAIGDGANDLPMLHHAGLGIAFHAKEKVRKEARHQMNVGPMTTILYFLGIPGNHL